MGMHTTKVAVGEGKFALEAQLTVTPRGMAVYACSPEFAHLGATAQAIPRPEPGRTATVSILAVPCHRDEIPAHDIAAALATRFGVPVVASTGFHVEQASGDDLQRVLDTTKELIAALVQKIRDLNDQLNIPQSIKDYANGGVKVDPENPQMVSEEEFLAKLPEIAANAEQDACTPENPRETKAADFEKILKACYYDTDIDF